MVNNSPANAGDVGSVPGLRRSPGEENGNPVQCSAWEIPWTKEPVGLWSTKSQTQLSDLTTNIPCSVNNSSVDGYSHCLFWLKLM